MKPSTILALAAPLLLVQGGYVRLVTPKLPEAVGPRTGSRALGADPRALPALAILIAGDSAAAGVGASHQDEALPGRMADALASLGLAGHVGWQVIARTGADTRDLVAMLGEPRPEPFDVAVVAIGVNDVTGRRSVAAWLADLERVAARLRALAPDALLLFSGLPPMHRFPALPQPLRAYLGARAREFDGALRAWAEGKVDTAYVAIPDTGDATLVASDGFHPGPGAYRVWAQQLAQEIGRRRVAAPPTP